jgi:polyhydroxyalkanoate synthesis regulator phasin
VITVREAIERTILLSLGAASLTRDRAEAIVDDFVHRGQLGGDEGKAIVDKVMARVRGEGAGGHGLLERIEGGVQGALREVGVASRQDLADILLRMDELEHRIKLLESAPPQPPPVPPPPPQ